MTVTRLGLSGEAKCSLCDKTLPDTQDYFENGVDCCRQCDGGQYLNRVGTTPGTPAPTPVSEGTKPCKECGDSKPLDDFAMNPHMKDGHINTCRLCKNKQVKERRLGMIKDRAKAVKKGDKPKRAYNKKAKPGKSIVKARDESGQLTDDWQDRMMDITGRIKKAKQDLADAKVDLQAACTELIEEI